MSLPDGTSAVFDFNGTSNRVTASALAVGPWSENAQHGGAVAALVVHLAERVPGLVEMEVARLTLELFRPVPLGVLDVASTLIREGKNLQLIEIDIAQEGLLRAQARVLRLRKASPALPELPTIDGASPTDFDQSCLPPVRLKRGFSQLVDIHPVLGRFGEVGPASAWFRLNGQIGKNEAFSDASRAAAAADFTNGLSNVLSFTEWQFMNADLSVNFSRQPVGEWIFVDAQTEISANGRALATARLGDRQRWFGRAAQTLFVQLTTH